MKFKCDILYSYTHMQYLFLLGGLSPYNKSGRFEKGQLQPQSNYTCSSQVSYNHKIFTSQNKTIQTDYGGEYITYIYMLNFFPFYILMNHGESQKKMLWIWRKGFRKWLCVRFKVRI